MNVGLSEYDSEKVLEISIFNKKNHHRSKIETTLVATFLLLHLVTLVTLALSS